MDPQTSTPTLHQKQLGWKQMPSSHLPEMLIQLVWGDIKTTNNEKGKKEICLLIVQMCIQG